MQESLCRVDAPLAPSLFYQVVQRFVPIGIVRILVGAGYDGLDTQIKWMPEDVQPTYFFQSGTRSKYFTGVVDDDSRWAMNCG